MQTSRVTRSSVLGKRAHQQGPSISLSNKSSDLHLPTPDSTPSPKRARTSLGYLDADSNKENVPPLSRESVGPDSSPTSARSARALRRTATELSTPSRPKYVRRHASAIIATPTTPAREVSQSFPVTPPTTPKTLIPLHARVKARLRATCNDATSTITCRDAERDVITQFLQSFMDDEPSKRCLYISGSPGTGKTALLNSVLQTFESKNCNILSLNCMALRNADDLWEKLTERLASVSNKKCGLKKPKGRAAAEAVLATLSTKCILVLDEMDHIVSDSRVMESILSLPEINLKSLCLIGIANTHTLTSDMNPGYLASGDVPTVHFSPYTATQLQAVLQARLQELYNDDQGSSDSGMAAFLPLPSLTLLTKKIAATTGDVRSLFEVLRGAINLAVTSSANTENPLSHSPKVTPTFILQALKSHVPSSYSAPNPSATPTVPVACNSEIVAKINGLNLQARVVLLSILMASKRLEAGLALAFSSFSPRKVPSTKRSPANGPHQACIDTAQLHSYYSIALFRSDAACLNIVSKGEFGDLLVILEGAGLVTSMSQSTASRQGKKAFGRSSSLNGFCKNLSTTEVRLVEGVWIDEILRGLGIAKLIDDDVLQSEIRGIWERETARIEREVENTKQSNLSNFD